MTESNNDSGKVNILLSVVIVLGVDTPIGVAILRDLSRENYKTVGIGRSHASIGFASRHCHVSVVRESTEAALIEQLMTLGENFAEACLLAVSESDLLLINRNRVELEKKLVVIAPTKKMLSQVLDKEICMSLAQQVGIRIPQTYNPVNIETIQQDAHKMTYPRVLKWSDPNKVSRALSEAGLKINKCDYVLNPQELISKLRPFTKVNLFPMVQEYCAGQGVGQMFLIRKGEIVLQFQHERIHEWPPEGGVSTYCKSIPLDYHKECRERSIALLKLLEWEGVAMVEYRFDRETGEYFFMEINGRFWGSLPLAIAAGVPFAAELVRSYSYEYRQKSQVDYPVIGCRYMIPESRRLLRLLFQRSKVSDPNFRYSKSKELFNYLIDFAKLDTRYYLFNLKDPGPFLKDLKNVIKKIINRGN